MPKSLSVLSAVCLGLMGAAAQGQNLFVLPGSNSNNNNVTVISGSTLTSVTNFTSGAGSFIVLAKPDGSKYYVVANQGSQTVTVLDSSFSNPKSLGNLGTQAAAAAITPDGRRVVVVAGTLHVFDTTSDFDLLPAGLNPGTNLIDVAISLDGSRAFVLGTNATTGGSTLYAIDLTNNSVVGNLQVGGTATGVSVGPNAFVYVSTINQVLEVNPATFAVTPSGTIALIGRPGKLVFTPDGKLALGINQAPYAGSSVVIIDLAAHTGSTLTGSATLDQLSVVGNNLVVAYSRSTQTLYQITLVPLAISALNIPGVATSGITAVAPSNEVPGGTRTTTQFLYLVSGNTLYRYDLTTTQITGQVVLPQTGAGAISIAGAANTTGVPASILQYGNNQQALAAGATTAPLVVRVLDAQGRPVSGVQVTFASTAAGITIQSPTVTTTPDGFAATTVIAPTANGLFVVSASVPGGQTVNFNLGVGITTGPSSSAQVSIVAGQGQIIPEFQKTGNGNSCLLVVVKDVSGAPVPNANVTFSIPAQSSGALTPIFVSSTRVDQCAPLAASGVGSQTGQNGSMVSVTTNSAGLAGVDFLSSGVLSGDFLQTPVTANAGGTNTVTFFITTAKLGLTSRQSVFFQVTNPLPSATITGQVGTTQAGGYIVKVVSNLGTPVPNVSLRLGNSFDVNNQLQTDPSMPSASCADPNGTGVLSDAQGTITCDLVFGPKTGSGSLIAEIGSAFRPPPFFLTVTPGPPAKVNIVQGNNQNGSAGKQLPLAFLVTVTDVGGNVLSGVPVTFKVTPAGALTLTNISSATDANGRASALGTAGNLSGAATVTATAGAGSATFTVNVVIPIGAIQAVSGSGQNAVVNTAFGAPLVVKVIDPSGNPVVGTQVTFAVTSGGATVASPTATTDSSGQASTTVTAGAGVGPITITAAAGGFTTTFSLTSRLSGPSNIAFVNGASFQPGIAPGAIVTITGSGIATGISGTLTPNSLIGPLPTTFNGAQVLFNGIAAPIYSISNVSGQEAITVQVPFEIAPGTATVIINAPGGGSTTLSNVPVAQFSPGVFETNFGNPNGLKYAVVIRASDGSYVTPTNPAHPGETDCLFATGLGQVSLPATTNAAGIPSQNVLAQMDIGVNNGGIRLVSATYLQGIVGVYQVCFQIPTDTTTGPYQPIGLVVHDAAGNGTFAQGTFIPIQ